MKSHFQGLFCLNSTPVSTPHNGIGTGVFTAPVLFFCKSMDPMSGMYEDIRREDAGFDNGSTMLTMKSTLQGWILVASVWVGISGITGDAQRSEAGSTAQVIRVLREYDGHPWEVVRGQGILTHCHDPRFVRDGLGSLHVAPGKKDRYWGVTLYRVDARGARALRAEIFHTGQKPAWLLVKVEDVKTRDRRNRLVQRVDVKPGWNRLEVNLAGARVRSGARALNLARPLHRIVIDRGGPRDPFLVDHLCLVLTPSASAKKLKSAFLRRFRGDDEADRVRAIHDLREMPEGDRVPLLLRCLKPSEPVWILHALVRELARCQEPASLEAILKRYARAKPPMKARFLDLLGALKFPRSRREVLRVAADEGAPEALRLAALRAAVRQGRADGVPGVRALVPGASWPLRAAGVHVLRMARVPDSVDGLIDILERSKNARVELDAYEALVDLTGQDFGYERNQWKGWWRQQKNRTLPALSDTRKVRGGYATFYGIPVRGSRIVFILDISGSMRKALTSLKARRHIAGSGHLEGKKLESRLDLAREELVHTLEQLPPTTAFNVGFFNDEVFWLHREMVPATPENVQDTAKRVRSMSAEQSTNVYEAMFQSMDAAWARSRTGREAGPDTIFFLSDGVPSVGKITRFSHLGDAVYDKNLTRFIRINTILVGEKGHRFLRRLARDSLGTFKDVGG